MSSYHKNCGQDIGVLRDRFTLGSAEVLLLAFVLLLTATLLNSRPSPTMELIINGTLLECIIHTLQKRQLGILGVHLPQMARVRKGVIVAFQDEQRGHSNSSRCRDIDLGHAYFNVFDMVTRQGGGL